MRLVPEVLCRRGYAPVEPALILDWLLERAHPGDLLLLGSRDPISRAIQGVTKSRFSHAAIINRDHMVTEAYDFHLTPSGNDEGVYHSSLRDLIRRYPHMSALGLYRPVSGDHEKLEHLCAKIVEHSPAYPTTQSLLFASARIAEGVSRAAPRGDWAVHRHVAWIGDGPERVQCAELVTRVYSSSGNGIKFTKPLLSRHIDIAEQPGDYETDDLVDPIDFRRGEAISRSWGYEASRTIKRVSRWYQQRDKPVRRGRMFRPDIADFIVPGDLTDTDAFYLIDSATFDRQGQIGSVIV